MIKFNRTLLILLLLILGDTTFAQKQIGYIITQKNDTIYCDRVKAADFNYKILKYRVKRNDDFKNIDTTSVKEYQLTSDSSIYIAKLLPDHDKMEYVQWIERGRINIYQRDVPTYNGGQTDVEWYVSKDGGPLEALITNRFSLAKSRKDRKKDFIKMISEQPDLVTWYEEDDIFEFDNVRDYIHRYNQAEAKLGYK